MIETIRELTTKSLKQQPIHSQSFTYVSDENYNILTPRLLNGIMNNSTVNDNLGDKNAVIPKNATVIKYWSN